MKNDAFTQYQLGQMGVRTGSPINEIGLDTRNPTYYPSGYNSPRRRRAPKPPPKWLTNPETSVEYAKLAGLNWFKHRRQTWIFWLLGLGLISTLVIVNLPASVSGVLGIGSSAPPVPWVRLGFAGLAGLIGWTGTWVALALGIPAISGAWTGMKEHWPTQWFRAASSATGLALATAMTATAALTMSGLTSLIVLFVLNM
jgi:hypothetical protein